LTNFETLSAVSQDSMFVRSLLAVNCNRNPQYHNKPGYKVHAIVDSLRTVISYTTSDCTSHDSNFVEDLLQKKYISDELLYPNIVNFYADSAYPSTTNIFNLTQSGFNVIMGRNKQHIEKGTSISHITKEGRAKYKNRTISENFFGNIERYPCLINIYEKHEKSYRGLFTFALCITLSRKINKIIFLMNNKNAIKRKKNKMKK
jgi:hypothetical protein